MSNVPTIILVPFDAALAKSLNRSIPSVRVGGIDIAAEAAAPVWLFIDLLLKDTSGLELCRRLRADPATQDARIFVVLEDTDREIRRRVLKAGADDYVPGPLSASTVLAKISEGLPLMTRTEAVLSHGMLKLDRDAHQVRAAGQPVPMGPNEFQLLAFFLENRDRVLSRSQLIGGLKGDCAIDARTVDVWVGRLRRALVAAKVPDPIRTVRQLGYVYDSY